MSLSNQRRQQILARLGIERLHPLTMLAGYNNQLSELQRPLTNLNVRGFEQTVDNEEIDANPSPNYMTVPARKCPTCAAEDQTVWVIPGKCCPRCGTYIDS